MISFERILSISLFPSLNIFVFGALGRSFSLISMEAILMIFATKNHHVPSIWGQNRFWYVTWKVFGYFFSMDAMTHSFSRRFIEQVEYTISPHSLRAIIAASKSFVWSAAIFLIFFMCQCFVASVPLKRVHSPLHGASRSILSNVSGECRKYWPG